MVRAGHMHGTRKYTRSHLHVKHFDGANRLAFPTYQQFIAWMMLLLLLSLMMKTYYVGDEMEIPFAVYTLQIQSEGECIKSHEAFGVNNTDEFGPKHLNCC